MHIGERNKMKYLTSADILRKLLFSAIITEDEMYEMDRLNRLSYSQPLIDSGIIM